MFQHTQTFGSIANNLFGEELVVKGIIKSVCVATGGAMILASFIQFRKYRKNPVETRLSQVVTTFIVGLIILLLYFLPMQF